MQRILQGIMILILSLTVFTVSLASSTTSNTPVSYQQQSITLAAAQILATNAQRACFETGFSSVVTVVDSHGLLKAVLVSDGSFPHAIETSLRKARTAASRRMPSGEVAGRNSHETSLSDVFHAIGLTSLGCGLPIVENGRVIGGSRHRRRTW